MRIAPYIPTLNTELKSSDPILQVLYDRYVRIDEERKYYWDRFFGKHPLSQPYQFPGTNDPEDKKRALELREQREKLFLEIEILEKRCQR